MRYYLDVNGIGHAEDLFYIWDFHFPKDKGPNAHDKVNQKRLLKMWTNFVKVQ